MHNQVLLSNPIILSGGAKTGGILFCTKGWLRSILNTVSGVTKTGGLKHLQNQVVFLHIYNSIRWEHFQVIFDLTFADSGGYIWPKPP